MKPAPFDYVRPGSLDDAIAALAGDPGAKVLAGGQSLVPLLSMRLAAPSRLVDINGLPGPRHDRGRRRRRPHRRAGPARRRAGVRRRTPRAAARQPGAGQRRPPDHPQPRHHRRLDRARRRGRRDADGAAAAGRLASRSAGPSGRRTIEADDLYVGPLESSLHHDEIAVVGVLPGAADGAGVAFEEIARRHGDYALCGVAALVTGETCKAGYLSVCEVPDRRRPDRCRRRRPRRRGARAPRPGRRHPRLRRLPRPARPGADRSGRGRGEEDGRVKAHSEGGAPRRPPAR